MYALDSVHVKLHVWIKVELMLFYSTAAISFVG